MDWTTIRQDVPNIGKLGSLSDSDTVILSKKIQEEVSRSLAVPGEVKVTVIREFRAVYPEAA